MLSLGQEPCWPGPSFVLCGWHDAIIIFGWNVPKIMCAWTWDTCMPLNNLPWPTFSTIYWSDISPIWTLLEYMQVLYFVCIYAISGLCRLICQSAILIRFFIVYMKFRSIHAHCFSHELFGMLGFLLTLTSWELLCDYICVVFLIHFHR